LTEPAEAHAPGTPPTRAEPADLQQALDDLTELRHRELRELITERRRCEELLAALPAEAAQTLRQRHQQLGASILELMEGWVALGGGISLSPPGIPQAETPPPPEVEPPAPQPAPSPSPRLAPPRPQVPPPEPPSQPERDWAEDLATLLSGLASSANAQEEMEAIQRAANASFSRWSQYPRSVQRALVGNLACRLRHLQDHLGVTGAKLDSAFRSLTRFSKSFQPGWVNGLTRGRGPAAPSWSEEARVWWDQLALSTGRLVRSDPRDPSDGPEAREEAVEAVKSWLQEWRDAPSVAKPMCMEKTLDAIQAALDAGVSHADPELCRTAEEIYDHLDPTRFRRLRQGIRDLELAEREEQGLEPGDAVPSDWAWWSHTVGRRALLLGPQPEADRQQRVESSFGLAGLRWLMPSADDDGLRDQLGAGGFDLVILQGAVQEDWLRAAIRTCQVLGLPWIQLEQGLGVTRVRMAIERFLQPDPRGEEALP
jgi:hypothetical protein